MLSVFAASLNLLSNDDENSLLLRAIICDAREMVEFAALEKHKRQQQFSVSQPRWFVVVTVRLLSY